MGLPQQDISEGETGVALTQHPLWARLDHLALTSPDPAALAEFYGEALGLRIERHGEGWIGRAQSRCMLFERGSARSMSFAAYAVDSKKTLAALAERLAAARHPIEACPTTLFAPGALCVRDPDGNRFVFGEPLGGAEEKAALRDSAPLPARLQHVVMASRDASRITDFFGRTLGFAVTDLVVDKDGNIRTSFLRCSRDHHSFAVFQAPENRLDHHCYEAGDWSLIRDWSDHFAAKRIALTWGPGRHGPGNNLFIFIHDPDGNWVELSAELEQVDSDRPLGRWPHEERTLNLWGQGLLRS